MCIYRRAAANQPDNTNKPCVQQGSGETGKARLTTPISMTGRRGGAPGAGAAGECIHHIFIQVNYQKHYSQFIHTLF